MIISTSCPTRLTLCANVVAECVRGHDSAADGQDGLYGQAFDPKKPNVRLSRQ